jgi:hypothetical protein
LPRFGFIRFGLTGRTASTFGQFYKTFWGRNFYSMAE